MEKELSMKFAAIYISPLVLIEIWEHFAVMNFGSIKYAQIYCDLIFEIKYLFGTFV